jgi:ABC-type transporter Mla subunit MlaD
MDDAKQAWDEVGDSFSKLGRKISEGYRQLEEQRPSDASAARTEGQREGAVADAIRRATDELDRAFTSLGDTLRDNETQEHLRDTSRKLGDALQVTFTAISEEVRRAARGRRPPNGNEGPPSSPPS